MENNTDQEFKELSPSEVRDLQLAMRYLFINYPQENLKEVIWDLYRGWVFNSSAFMAYGTGMKLVPK